MKKIISTIAIAIAMVCLFSTSSTAERGCTKEVIYSLSCKFYTVIEDCNVPLDITITRIQIYEAMQCSKIPTPMLDMGPIRL